MLLTTNQWNINNIYAIYSYVDLCEQVNIILMNIMIQMHS